MPCLTSRDDGVANRVGFRAGQCPVSGPKREGEVKPLRVWAIFLWVAIGIKILQPLEFLARSTTNGRCQVSPANRLGHDQIEIASHCGIRTLRPICRGELGPTGKRTEVDLQ